MITPYDRPLSLCILCAREKGVLQPWLNQKGGFELRGFCTCCGFISATVTLIAQGPAT